MKKKKLIILTVDHVYANYTVKQLINKFGEEIALIIESDCLYYNKSFFRSLLKYNKVSGSKYIFYQAIKLEIYKILSLLSDTIIKNKQNKFYSYKRLAENKNIKIIKAKNVNDKKYLKILKHKKPDLLVSVFFNQILKSETIKTAKHGAINIHPAYLPDYKGVSPVFWALANNEKYAGIAVHTIDSGIDTGRIISRKKVNIDKEDTEDSLYWRLTEIGLPFLIDSIHRINKKKYLKIDNSKGQYYSLPTRKAVSIYLKKRPFFRFKKYIFNDSGSEHMKLFWLEHPSIYNAIQYLATGGFMSSVMKVAPYLEGSSIFDLGCGTGGLTKYTNPEKYLGWDINKQFIDNAQKNQPIKYKFQVKDVVNDKFPNSEFDYVIITNVLHHLTLAEVDKLFAKIAKWKKAKHFIIIESKPKNIIGLTIAKFDAGDTFREYGTYKKMLKEYFNIEQYNIVAAPFGTYTYLVTKLSPR